MSPTIKRVLYVEGLITLPFLVGQFCDADLEVAFSAKSTLFVRDLQGIRFTNLVVRWEYPISTQYIFKKQLSSNSNMFHGLMRFTIIKAHDTLGLFFYESRIETPEVLRKTFSLIEFNAFFKSSVLLSRTVLEARNS
ncbi:hypothetical protein Tco_1163504 [Tanacetum coccineum]